MKSISRHWYWHVIEDHKSNHNRPPLDLFQRITVFFFSSAKSDKSGQDMEHLDFKIVVEPKDSQSFTIILVASSRQEKSAWTSDISQACLLTSDSTEWSTQPWGKTFAFYSLPVVQILSLCSFSLSFSLCTTVHR